MTFFLTILLLESTAVARISGLVEAPDAYPGLRGLAQGYTLSPAYAGYGGCPFMMARALDRGLLVTGLPLDVAAYARPLNLIHGPVIQNRVDRRPQVSARNRCVVTWSTVIKLPPIHQPLGAVE